MLTFNIFSTSIAVYLIPILLFIIYEVVYMFIVRSDYIKVRGELAESLIELNEKYGIDLTSEYKITLFGVILIYLLDKIGTLEQINSNKAEISNFSQN